MHGNTIEPLAWDSNFFGYPVAKIEFSKEGGYHLDKILCELLSQKIKLAYFFVNPKDKDLNAEIVKKGGLLVDQKIFFSKAPEKYNNFKNPISVYTDNVCNEKTKSLAIQAGTHSRFRIDKNFTNQEYEKLYIEWLRKSLEKQIAFKTIVAIKDSDIAGIVTLKKEDSNINIGLLSVNEKYHRQGIGFDLIHYADSNAFDLGYKEITVTTQLTNLGACQLYEKCGFQIKGIINIYHYWKK